MTASARKEIKAHERSNIRTVLLRQYKTILHILSIIMCLLQSEKTNKQRIATDNKNKQEKREVIVCMDPTVTGQHDAKGEPFPTRSFCEGGRFQLRSSTVTVS